MCGDQEPSGPPDAHEGWFFVDPSRVPDRWRERAVPVCLVPLLPEEAASILEGSLPELSEDEEQLARLVAAGASVTEMAGHLYVSNRSVQRRLARLRRRLGVETTAQLAALLARRGFP